MNRTDQKKMTPAVFLGRLPRPRERKLMKASKDDIRLSKARLQMIGVCLVDSAYAWHVPASIHLSEYGAFLIMMVQRGMGLDSIVSYLEGYGIHDASKMLSEALESIPDRADCGKVFWQSVRVLAEGVAVP